VRSDAFTPFCAAAITCFLAAEDADAVAETVAARCFDRIVGRAVSDRHNNATYRLSLDLRRSFGVGARSILRRSNPARGCDAHRATAAEHISAVMTRRPRRTPTPHLH